MVSTTVIYNLLLSDYFFIVLVRWNRCIDQMVELSFVGKEKEG